MKKVIAKANFGFWGAEHKTEFEFEDDATEEEMEEVIWEWAAEYIDISFEVLDEE